LSKKEHMEAIAPYADAAIVGSAIMRVVEDARGSADLPRRLEALAAELKSGLRAAAAKS
jgi:tryptophan synthase alpha subunit